MEQVWSSLIWLAREALAKSEFKIISQATKIRGPNEYLNDKCLESWFGEISYE